MNSKEKLCPYCSEKIIYSAKKCKHCGERLDDEERERHQSQSDKLISQAKPFAKVYIIFSIVIFIIVLIFFLYNWNKFNSDFDSRTKEFNANWNKFNSDFDSEIKNFNNNDLFESISGHKNTFGDLVD